MSNFSSLGEFCKAIINSSKGIHDERLVKATGQNEGIDSDGGYLVTNELIDQILSGIQQSSVILPKTKQFRCNNYGALLPLVSETTRSSGGGGNFNTFWRDEGSAKIDDKVAFYRKDLAMHKLVGLMYVTDQLMQDGQLFNSFIDGFVGERLAWEIDRAILMGDAATSMFGIMGPAGSQGIIGVAEADPLTEAVLENYVKALAPAATRNAEWYMSKENYNDVLDITFTQPNCLIYQAGVTYLYGFKINVMEQMHVAGASQLDLVLGDFSQYAVVIRSGITKGINVSIKWLTDEQILRWVIRLNGAAYGQRYTLEDGTDVGTFVIPATSPADESSSSSSSTSSSSSMNYSQSTQSASTSSSSSTDLSESSQSSERYSQSSDSSSSSSTDISDSSESSSSSVDYSNSSDTSSSSSTDLSDSSESSSSSQSALGGCAEDYCASGFNTPAYNGTYAWAGWDAVTSKPYYFNGNYYVWYDSVTGYWAMSDDKGDPQNQWVSSSDTATPCPNGDWTREDGTLTAGKC